MAKKKKKETIAEVRIIFPNAPKKAKDRKALFNTLLSLVEKDEESLPVEVKSNKKRKFIILDSDEFMFVMSFRKPVSTQMLVNNPNENIDTANEVGEKVINYMNSILGDEAKGSMVGSTKTVSYGKKIFNLSEKLVGRAKVVKMNEEVRQTLKPISIGIEYDVKDKTFAFFTLSDKTDRNRFASVTTYKDKIPFNVLRKEYDELASPEEFMEKLKGMEL